MCIFDVKDIMTEHDKLVEKAANFLKYKKNCQPVFMELVAGTAGGEIPDVIGWKWGRSYLIECKTSRSDFLADRKKPFRNVGNYNEHQVKYAMGQYRYYFVPEGLIEPEEVQEDWGLIVLDGRSTKEIIAADGKTYKNEHAINSEPIHNKPTIESLQNEIKMLTSFISRIDVDNKYLK